MKYLDDKISGSIKGWGIPIANEPLGIILLRHTKFQNSIFQPEKTLLNLKKHDFAWAGK